MDLRGEVCSVMDFTCNGTEIQLSGVDVQVSGIKDVERTGDNVFTLRPGFQGYARVSPGRYRVIVQVVRVIEGDTL